MGQPCFISNSSCCFLSNSRVLAAMAFCFSATLMAFSLLKRIRSLRVSLKKCTVLQLSPNCSHAHLSNISLALVLSSLLQVARDSSSWIREEVPSAAPTHTSRPDSWICQLWWIGRIFNDYKVDTWTTLRQLSAESATLMLRMGTSWLWRKSHTST